MENLQSNKNLYIWQFSGFVITCFLGTILHFLFDWTNSIIVAPFSAVNESTWEHMKIMFFPMFIFAIIQWFCFKNDYKNFWCVKLKGILLGLFLIPALFYFYNGAIGKSPDFVNILIFFIAAFIAFWYETILFKQNLTKCKQPILAFIALCLIAIAFIVLTFVQPKIPLFIDPTNGLYEIN